MSGDRPAPAIEPPDGDGASRAPSDAAATTHSTQRELAQFTLEEIMRPAAIAGMLTCLAISMSQVLSMFAPDWPAGFFALLTFGVALESIHAQRLLSRRRLASSDRYRFRFVEWVIILLVVRFGVYISYGTARLMADMAIWTTNLGAFFEARFLMSSLFLAVFWYLALSLSRTMQELEASPIEKMPSITDPDYYLRSTMPHRGRVDRQSRLDRIVSIFFWGGALLLLLTGVAQVDVRELIVLQHSRSSGVILNALVYFLIGLLIISQAQYTILKANWELQGIPVLDRLGRRWVVLVALFLLLIGLIAAFLPVSYSVGILNVLYTAVRWIIYAAVQFAFLLLFAISYLLSFFMRFFSSSSGESGPPPMTRVAPPPVPPTIAQEPALWWQVARSLIFWAILTGVVGYSLYHFMRDRWGIFEGFSTCRLFGWLGSWWRALRRGGQRALARIQEVAQRLTARRARLEGSAWRYLSLRRLSPRARVRYFYLSTLRRGDEQGLGRPPALTPLEYQGVLAKALPEEDEQVRSLTTAFIVARYSEHSISREDAKGIQALWKQVRRALTLHKRVAKDVAPHAAKDAAPHAAKDAAPRTSTADRPKP